MNHLTRTGLAVSTQWLIAFAVATKFLEEQALAMRLNEWGDFLAGLSALTD